MRLVDADALSSEFGVSDSDIIAKEAIDDAPTIDAVPVVRCRECKYAGESEEAFDLDGETPLCECAYMAQPNRWNEFCSWGERKEAGHDKHPSDPV